MSTAKSAKKIATFEAGIAIEQDEAAAPGRPKQGSAPSGGSAARAAASVGATTRALLLMFWALKGATFRPWRA